MQTVQKIERVYSDADLALLEQMRKVAAETAETIARHTLQLELGTLLSGTTATLDDMWATLEQRRGLDHANSVRVHLGRVVAEYNYAIVKKVVGVLTPRIVMMVAADEVPAELR